MNGVELTYSKTAVYLGITLDTKLEYKPHIHEKCKQGIRLYMALRGALGQLWGPSPKAMQWAYQAIVRPRVLYGAIVWADRAALASRYLICLQRMALLSLSLIHI